MDAQKALRYDRLDGLRSIGAIGIVLMHVLVNGDYNMGGFLFGRLIPSLTDLVFPFMVISGLSMCCGYYEKTVSGQLDLGRFYAKRFSKAWPFFAALCLLDFAMSPSLGNLCELLADLTLCFGLIPHANISVIGVGWFLGVVFVFYFLFPFFCSLLSNKKKAWLAFGVTLLLNFLCASYFGAGRTSFAYSAVYFMAGGLLYVYREPLGRFAQRFGWALLLGLAGALVLYYGVGAITLVRLLVSCLMVVYAMKPVEKGHTLLSNPVTKAISNISMEIYLCHMIIFRLIEKLGLAHPVSSDVLSYTIAAVATLAGAVVFSLAAKKTLSWVGGVISKKKE